MQLSHPKAGVHTDALQFGCSNSVSVFFVCFIPSPIDFYYVRFSESAQKIWHDASLVLFQKTMAKWHENCGYIHAAGKPQCPSVNLT